MRESVVEAINALTRSVSKCGNVLSLDSSCSAPLGGGCET